MRIITQPSKPALFEFIGADLVRTDCKLDRVSQRVNFPPQYATSRLFILNAQVRDVYLLLTCACEVDDDYVCISFHRTGRVCGETARTTGQGTA